MPDETFNEILGNTPPGKAVAGMAPELQQQSAPVTGAGNKTSGMAPENTQNNTREPLEPITPAPTPKATQQNQSDIKPQQPQSMTYTEMIQRLSPYVPPTPEELEKERKREKQKRLWAAIGDGIAAFSNLYFASQSGISNYKSMSKPLNERLEKMREEREKNNQRYLSLYMSARQQDDAADRWKRDFEYRAEQDKARNEESARRWQEQFDYQKGRDNVADERYAAEQEYKKGRDKDADDKWNKQFEEGQRRANQSHALAVQRQQDSFEIQKHRIDASEARGVRGKQLGFSNGDGDQVSIYENVWKGSMQQVYDVLVEDMKAAYEADKQHNHRVPRHKTEKEKEDYVKQNWHKSPRAASIMLALSQIDPATMRSEISEDDDDFESYRTDTEEDFEQYRQN